jgi:hypothetical protein
MRLRPVTVTGADVQTSVDDLASISAEYPFVEWGVLLTAKSGRPMFPSPAWVDRLRGVAGEGMRLSAHVCSTWAKAVCAGHWPAKLRVEGFGRVQLNIGRHLHAVESAEHLARCLLPNHEFILQVGKSRERGVSLARELQQLGVVISVLFDQSGGKGVTPKNWPAIPDELRCPFGFAGGLGPHNLALELRRLAELVGEREIWVDIQTHARSLVQSDSVVKLDRPVVMLDLEKVRTCLELCRPYIL